MTSRFAHQGSTAAAFVPENRTDTFALLDANWKLIYRDKAKETGLNKIELYDRHTDRSEKKDVASLHPQDVERMTARMNKWIDAQKQIRSVLGQGGKSTLDQKTLEQLRSLGYIGGNK
jgi:hypothetical protein